MVQLIYMNFSHHNYKSHINCTYIPFKLIIIHSN